MPIKILLFLLGLATVLPLTLAFLNDDGQFGIYALPFAILLAIVIVFRPQLDWAWQLRHPRDLDSSMVRMLESKLPSWYGSIPSSARLDFRQRTALISTGLDFKPQGQEDKTLPGEVEVLIASQAARLSLASDLIIPKPFETIVVYKHPFPSPQFPLHFHSSEIFTEDGVVLFSLPLALAGILSSQTYFNIVLYEWARAYDYSINKNSTVKLELPPWPEMVQNSNGLSSEWVQDAVGLDYIDSMAVAQVLRLDFPAAFAKTYPELSINLAHRLKG